MTAQIVWLIATAIMTITVLAVGTMAAAGMFPRQKRAVAAHEEARAEQLQESRVQELASAHR